jgi:hypothetical protein
MFADMMTYADSANSYVDTVEGRPRHLAYARLRNSLEAALVEKLEAGALLASGIRQGDDRRRLIHPSLWDILEVDYDFDSIDGQGQHYESAEIFEPSAIPNNLSDLPDWIREPSSAGEGGTIAATTLVHDDRYKRVTLNGAKFFLGAQQAKVICCLHQASVRGDPWQHIKAIQHQTGIGRMRDVFGRKQHWESLLLSNRRGLYRLRNDPG